MLEYVYYLVYDFAGRRVANILKLCRKYLNWIQNSVCEGEISEVRLKELLFFSRELMNGTEDRVVLFKDQIIVFWRKK